MIKYILLLGAGIFLSGCAPIIENGNIGKSMSDEALLKSYGNSKLSAALVMPVDIEKFTFHENPIDDHEVGGNIAALVASTGINVIDGIFTGGNIITTDLALASSFDVQIIPEAVRVSYGSIQGDKSPHESCVATASIRIISAGSDKRRDYRFPMPYTYSPEEELKREREVYGKNNIAGGWLAPDYNADKFERWNGYKCFKDLEVQVPRIFNAVVVDAFADLGNKQTPKPMKLDFGLLLKQVDDKYVDFYLGSDSLSTTYYYIPHLHEPGVMTMLTGMAVSNVARGSSAGMFVASAIDNRMGRSSDGMAASYFAGRSLDSIKITKSLTDIVMFNSRSTESCQSLKSSQRESILINKDSCRRLSDFLKNYPDNSLMESCRQPAVISQARRVKNLARSLYQSAC